MTEVVSKPCKLNAQYIIIGDTELGLLVSKVSHLYPRKVSDANRVLLPRVAGRRIDVLTSAELLDGVKTLKLGRVHHSDK